MRLVCLLILFAEVGVAAAAQGHCGMAGVNSKGTLEDAEHVRSSLSNGVSRIKLEDAGISWLNRLINGKHAHRVGRRIVSVEGFVRFRYRNAIAHEGDPANPLRVARHTNEMALRDPLLAPVPMKSLIATCGKSHLQSWLQALKSGAV